jgi:hypothetical protein
MHASRCHASLRRPPLSIVLGSDSGLFLVTFGEARPSDLGTGLQVLT